MRPIGISGVGLTCNTEPIGVTFRSILESTIEASEAASIGIHDRRNCSISKLTSPSSSVGLFQESFFFVSRIMSLSRKTENK
jgi:hypothetical protein